MLSQVAVGDKVNALVIIPPLLDVLALQDNRPTLHEEVWAVFAEARDALHGSKGVRHL